jgi:Elongation factor Tu GTP binding domain
MAVERERGISVSSVVMSFEHGGLAFNLLDTPGHQDFSPLGFQPTGISAKTPTAPRPRSPHPSLPRPRGRVREGATRRRPQRRQGGIEEQTRKLFEVCRLRDVPIITFLDKLEHAVHDRVTEPVRCSGLDDPQLPRLLPKTAIAKLRGKVGAWPPLYKIIIQRAGISQHAELTSDRSV